MGKTTSINYDNLAGYKLNMDDLAIQTDIQTKIEEIRDILSQSTGDTASELEDINSWLETIEESMRTLIKTTASTLQTVYDYFWEIDENSITDN